MKRTKIHYIELDFDTIKIVKVENAVNRTEMVNLFGEAIVTLYELRNPHYFTTFLENKEGKINSFGVGTIFSKSSFKYLIKELKEAGKRLQLIRKTQANSIMTVTI